MATPRSNKGILQYWPQILSMVTVVGAGGVFYNKVETAFTEIKNIKTIEIKNATDRQDRQFELIQRLESRIIELEKRTEYYRGLRDGRTNTVSRPTSAE